MVTSSVWSVVNLPLVGMFTVTGTETPLTGSIGVSTPLNCWEVPPKVSV